jgi:hypothetical protein
MTERLDHTNERFEQRFHPRRFENVCLLAFGDDFKSDDLSFLNTGVESMVGAGISGFVFELTQFYRLGDFEEGLGHLVRCIPLVHRTGGVLNWLHGGRFVQEWRRLKLLGIPPESFETEREAVEGLRAVLKAARIRTDLVQRLANCGVSAAQIANIAGLLESDVRRIAAGQEEPSDGVALLLSSALDSLSMQKISAKRPEGVA